VRTCPRPVLAILAILLTAAPLAESAFPEPATGGSPDEELALGPGDLRIEQRDDGGYHLFIRAKSGLGSILLTESTKDPANKADSFAYRSLERNSINGDETRIISGKKLANSGEFHFLVASSLRPDAIWGHSFHIFIPWTVAWGYPWSRSGTVSVHDGTFINIRAFAKPYADYSGPFRDNPYLVRVTQAAATSVVTAPAQELASVPPDSLYIPETLASYRSVTAGGRGELRRASSDRDIAAQIDELIAREKGRSLDLVFCLDTTDSMKGGLAELRSTLPAILERRASGFPSLRVGIVAFKDYFEEYLYRRFGFTHDIVSFGTELDSLQGGGGRDISEAVYEALHAAIEDYSWSARSRLVILVSPAPPHPLPRGTVDKADVISEAASMGVKLDAVVVPK
jgi:hypothetical protein